MSFKSTIRNPQFYILLILGFIILGYIIYPSATVLWESFFRDGRMSLQNYADFFDLESTSYIEGLFNSIWVAFASVLISALIGVPLALIFSTYEFPGRSIFAALATLPIVLPPLVGVISFLFL